VIITPYGQKKSSDILNIDFKNKEAETFFWSTFRNNCFSGGFGNAKTFTSCQRQFVMLRTFPGYISLFARQTYKDLKATTMKTFFKICPQDFVLKHDLQEGITVFINGSVALWLHLDSFDEKSLRGLEINSATLDQAEEIYESIYLVLDSRIGRWDGAQVPDELLLKSIGEDIWKQVAEPFDDVIDNPALAKLKEELITKYAQWPKDPDCSRFRVRNFMYVLCNPEDETHWIYRRFHPESLERKKNHFYIERETDEKLNDPETIENMKDRDPEWVEKYFQGRWGKSRSTIHRVNKLSVIDPNDYDQKEFEAFLRKILTKGALYRAFDYGDTSPSCCLWFSAFNNLHIGYREYYVPDQSISFHRFGITELSKNDYDIPEEYVSDIADPSIFHKTRRSSETSRNNFKTSIADEFSTDEIDGPPIFWSSGDNNELATRNRINELLNLNTKYAHPITKESPAPGLYFIRSCDIYPYGCNQSILQLKAQKKLAVGSDNGRVIYSSERDENVTDHAYDPTRYYIAEHSLTKPGEVKDIPERSFANFERIRRNNNRLILPGI
jgi:hypothetical protein